MSQATGFFFPKPLSGAATYIKSQPIAGFRGSSYRISPWDMMKLSSKAFRDLIWAIRALLAGEDAEMPLANADVRPSTSAGVDVSLRGGPLHHSKEGTGT
jgi:hypothetical protein